MKQALRAVASPSEAGSRVHQPTNLDARAVESTISATVGVAGVAAAV